MACCSSGNMAWQSLVSQSTTTTLALLLGNHLPRLALIRAARSPNRVGSRRLVVPSCGALGWDESHASTLYTYTALIHSVCSDPYAPEATKSSVSVEPGRLRRREEPKSGLAARRGRPKSPLPERLRLMVSFACGVSPLLFHKHYCNLTTCAPPSTPSPFWHKKQSNCCSKLLRDSRVHV